MLTHRTGQHDDRCSFGLRTRLPGPVSTAMLAMSRVTLPATKEDVTCLYTTYRCSLAVFPFTRCCSRAEHRSLAGQSYTVLLWQHNFSCHRRPLDRYTGRIPLHMVMIRGALLATGATRTAR